METCKIVKNAGTFPKSSLILLDLVCQKGLCKFGYYSAMLWNDLLFDILYTYLPYKMHLCNFIVLEFDTMSYTLLKMDLLQPEMVVLFDTAGHLGTIFNTCSVNKLNKWPFLFHNISEINNNK